MHRYASTTLLDLSLPEAVSQVRLRSSTHLVPPGPCCFVCARGGGRGREKKREREMSCLASGQHVIISSLEKTILQLDDYALLRRYGFEEEQTTSNQAERTSNML